MESSLGFIKSPKVLLLLFGALGILTIASLSVSISNIDKISEESKNTEDERAKLDERIKALEGGDDSDGSGGKFEICKTSECYEIANHLRQRIDMSMDPCYDFYQFTCGKWIDSMPNVQANAGTFEDLEKQINEAIWEIFQKPADDKGPKTVKKAKLYYKSCINTNDMEVSGKAFYQRWLTPKSTTGGYPLLNSLWQEKLFNLEESLSTHFYYFGETILLQTYVGIDSKDTNKHAIHIEQGSLSLIPNIYNDPGEHAALITAYKKLQKESTKVLAGYLNQPVPTDADIDSAIEDMFKLETALANITIPADEGRDPEAKYNPTKLSDMKNEYPGFDWEKHVRSLLRFANVNVESDEKIIVLKPQYLSELVKIVQATHPRILANYAHWRIIMQTLPNGPKRLRELFAEFLTTGLKVKVKGGREEGCIKMVSAPFPGMGGLGFAVAYEYVNMKFEDSAKKEANELVDNLRVAFKELVTESLWMDDETQGKAAEKADNMIQSLGYPDWLKEDGVLDDKYKELGNVGELGLLNDIVEVKRFEIFDTMAKLRNKPDRESWYLHPAVVNAVYSPNQNSITFPAGILQYPFFKSGIPTYLNYGSIGVVIGHEITHGFDDQGKNYDKDGNLNNWWTDEANKNFEKEVECLVKQYGSYYVEEIDENVNGVMTQGENIADNGGLRESYRAYIKSLASKDGSSPKRLPGLTQFTPEQLFFIAYSQTWCEVQTKNSLANQVLTNPHSPGKFRSWGAVSNSIDFVEHFKCPEGSPMNRGKDRCQIW